MLLIIEEVVKGDRHDSRTDPLTGVELNPFNWESVRLNLPGPGYDPRLPWVSKIRESDGRVACDVLTFVDDQRATGPDENLTWQASSTLAKKEQYLGGQDAARKVRPPTQYPGAWAGHVVHVVDKLGVCVTTSEEKWNKLKAILTKWMERVQAGDTKLSHKELISDRGFLVYVTQAFPSMVPYLRCVMFWPRNLRRAWSARQVFESKNRRAWAKKTPRAVASSLLPKNMRMTCSSSAHDMFIVGARHVHRRRTACSSVLIVSAGTASM